MVQEAIHKVTEFTFMRLLSAGYIALNLFDTLNLTLRIGF